MPATNHAQGQSVSLAIRVCSFFRYQLNKANLKSIHWPKPKPHSPDCPPKSAPAFPAPRFRGVALLIIVSACVPVCAFHFPANLIDILGYRRHPTFVKHCQAFPESVVSQSLRLALSPGLTYCALSKPVFASAPLLTSRHPRVLLFLLWLLFYFTVLQRFVLGTSFKCLIAEPCSIGIDRKSQNPLETYASN